MKEKSLRELFYEHTGKLVHKWDHYFEIYEKYFEKYRGKKINLLEIGISHGGSMQLWKKYFGNQVHVYAIDINPECKMLEEDNTTVFIGSQSDKNFLSNVISQIPELDIVIDDGGHTMLQQKVSFDMLYLKVKEGGVYIVEDTHTSYWHAFHGGLGHPNSFIEYSKKMIDSLYDGHVNNKKRLLVNERTRNINSIHFYDSIVVFEKLPRQEPFHIRKGAETTNPFVQRELHSAPGFLQSIARLFGSKDTYALNDRGKLH